MKTWLRRIKSALPIENQKKWVNSIMNKAMLEWNINKNIQKSSDCAGKPPIFTNDVSYNYAFGALCSSQHSADFSTLVT
jgi:hypothetical protein